MFSLYCMLFFSAKYLPDNKIYCDCVFNNKQFVIDYIFRSEFLIFKLRIIL